MELLAGSRRRRLDGGNHHVHNACDSGRYANADAYVNPASGGNHDRDQSTAYGLKDRGTCDGHSFEDEHEGDSDGHSQNGNVIPLANSAKANHGNPCSGDTDQHSRGHAHGNGDPVTGTNFDVAQSEWVCLYAGAYKPAQSQYEYTQTGYAHRLAPDTGSQRHTAIS